MHIVTLSGFKGGTGKTTLAGLVALAGVLDGRRTAVLDLDRQTRNLSLFVSLRRAAGLAAPDAIHLMDDGPARRGFLQSKDEDRLTPLIHMAEADGYEMLVIDTSCASRKDFFDAHKLADTLITPMNESPADLHSLFAPLYSPNAPDDNYYRFIQNVRWARRRTRRGDQNWHVCFERASARPTKIGRAMQEKLGDLRAKAGFDEIFRVCERVGHRSMCLNGETIFDAPAGGATMSVLAARSEVRRILRAIPFAEPLALAA